MRFFARINLTTPLNIILITVKLLQQCSWNLVYVWIIFQGIAYRINIVYVSFLRKWYLTFRTKWNIFKETV